MAKSMKNSFWLISQGVEVHLASTLPDPVPLFFSSSKRLRRTFLLLPIFFMMPLCWLAKLHNIMNVQCYN